MKETMLTLIMTIFVISGLGYLFLYQEVREDFHYEKRHPTSPAYKVICNYSITLKRYQRWLGKLGLNSHYALMLSDDRVKLSDDFVWIGTPQGDEELYIDSINIEKVYDKSIQVESDGKVVNGWHWDEPEDFDGDSPLTEKPYPVENIQVLDRCLSQDEIEERFTSPNEQEDKK